MSQTETRHNIRVAVITVALGIAFGLVFLFTQGTTAFAQYETAFFLEKMLSVDNLAVMATIFTAFRCVGKDQHKALTYGIAGAIVMRLGFIMVGAEALERFEFMSVVFGAILGYSAWKMLRSGHDEGEPGAIRFVRRFFPKLSTLVAVIFVIELTDVIFAIDSVPVVLSITDDRWIALTSNIAAILGMRSLFFVLKDGMERIVYLNQTLAVVLAYVGAKMALHKWVHINEALNIGIVAVMFTVGIVASLVIKPKNKSLVLETNKV
jgi:tellurite resistance protein TerC